MANMFRAIRKVVGQNVGVKVVYPIHMNPVVRYLAKKYLRGEDRIRIIDPLDVVEFHNLINE